MAVNFYQVSGRDRVAAQVRAAFRAGFDAGSGWRGPNNNGSMGALSHEFVTEMAERFACGWRFADLLDGPSRSERRVALAFIAGHEAGRDAADATVRGAY